MRIKDVIQRLLQEDVEAELYYLTGNERMARVTGVEHHDTRAWTHGFEDREEPMTKTFLSLGGSGLPRPEPHEPSPNDYLPSDAPW